MSVAALRRWWISRLSHRIAAPTIIISILFLSLQGLLSIRIGRRIVSEIGRERSYQVVQMVSREIENFTHGVVDTVRLVATQAVLEKDAARRYHALVNLRVQFPYTYGDLFILDADANAITGVTGALRISTSP